MSKSKNENYPLSIISIFRIQINNELKFTQYIPLILYFDNISVNTYQNLKNNFLYETRIMNTRFKVYDQTSKNYCMNVHIDKLNEIIMSKVLFHYIYIIIEGCVIIIN